MFRALNGFIMRISASGRLFLAAAVVACVSLAALIGIGAGFRAVSGGALPFDLQHDLTAEQVLAQLPGYTVQARRQYALFTAIDFVFPLAAGLVLAAGAAFCLRRAFPATYASLVQRQLFPLLLSASLLDWCENVAAITAITAFPDTTAAMATALVVAKDLKLTFLAFTQALTLLLALAAAGTWLTGRGARGAA